MKETRASPKAREKSKGNLQDLPLFQHQKKPAQLTQLLFSLSARLFLIRSTKASRMGVLLRLLLVT